MRIAVIGSRGIAAIDFAAVGAKPGDIIVSGGAKGVDSLAAKAAEAAGLGVELHLPNYALYGRAAPHVRNREIVRACDRLVAFWDGVSRGTAGTVALARRMGKPVEVVTMSEA